MEGRARDGLGSELRPAPDHADIPAGKEVRIEVATSFHERFGRPVWLLSDLPEVHPDPAPGSRRRCRLPKLRPTDPFAGCSGINGLAVLIERGWSTTRNDRPSAKKMSGIVFTVRFVPLPGSRNGDAARFDRKPKWGRG